MIQGSQGASLVLEFDRDDILHFAYWPSDAETGDSIPVSPMVSDHERQDLAEFTHEGNRVATAAMVVEVNPDTLCFTITDKVKAFTAGTFCPRTELSGLTVAAPEMQNAYGLGEQFFDPGSSSGDWVGRVRDSGNDSKIRGTAFGNNMGSFNGGSVGNAQFPILYAVGADSQNFAFFLDNTSRQRWDLRSRPWQVETGDNRVRGFVMLGPDLPDLRRDYMELVGRPPVPPKKAFGLWVSEYGYDNWGEMEEKLETLRAARFPVDGFVLDLQWFGGIQKNSETSAMGGLNWDLRHFPDPAGKIETLGRNEGLGIVVIEESYMSKGLPEHQAMAEKGYLAHDDPEAKKSSYISYNPWWGLGGMIDWTNPDAAKFWHDWKRQPLVEMGVMGHWTDLGEPEMFEPTSYYNHGRFRHAEIHNVFNLLWSQSIYDGYNRHDVQTRPWILSRSGTSGSQRFGVAMWSGDIGSNLESLSSHLNAQMHMSFSGMDYFGSDIGGFIRKSLKGDLNEMYTQWFAVSTVLDVPVRPHTENLCNCRETAPDRIGDRASNLFNLRQRYALVPYYYSLAHAAYRSGDPVVAPAVFYYQDVEALRESGDQKLIGRDLMVATIAQAGQNQRDVFLPQGSWYDFHSHERIESRGEWLRGVPAKVKGVFRLPLFAREGAILPMARVDESTTNVFGRRSDGTFRDDLVVRVYPSRTPSQFVLYEDDGRTTDYLRGKVRTTAIEQVEDETGVTVVLNAAQGEYEGNPERSTLWMELVTGNRVPDAVTLNGQSLTKVSSAAELEAVDSGWTLSPGGFLIAKGKDLSRRELGTWRVEWSAPVR
ncbi:MAG: TIM-barrel domain-containing protein [Bdellovibrionales bacterium]